jgi:hypothetical protein
MMSSTTQARDQVSRLAKSDPAAALTVARSIDDPWFGTQALAWAARFGPSDRVEAVTDEALRRARTSDDPYRVVASSAWPLRALVERGLFTGLPAHISRLLTQSERIENRASLSQALFLIFEATAPADRRIWLPILERLISTSHPVVHWRQRRNLRDAILVAATRDLSLARERCDQVQDTKARRQIEIGLAGSKLQKPREFFW